MRDVLSKQDGASDWLALFCETWLVTSRRWSDPPEELPDSPPGEMLNAER
jgi:hypothetical protein